MTEKAPADQAVIALAMEAYNHLDTVDQLSLLQPGYEAIYGVGIALTFARKAPHLWNWMVANSEAPDPNLLDHFIEVIQEINHGDS